MQSLWQFRLFGGLQTDPVAQDEQHVAFGRFETRKTAALFALLAIAPDHAHPREELAEALWPDDAIEAVRNRFKQTLAQLRRQLEPPGQVAPNAVLIADRSEVRLAPGSVATDVAEFKTLLRRATTMTDAADKVTALRTAVDLYHGELLPGFYEDALLAERERLRERHRVALMALAEAFAQTGDIGGARDAAQRAIAVDPLQEDAHLLLLRLHAEAGRAADAQRTFREMERVLEEKLGTSPSTNARRLLERAQQSATTEVVSRIVTLSPTVVASPEATRTVVHNLPPQVTAFFGREGEIDALTRLLSPAEGEWGERLITLIGTGGSGKTRLAGEVMARLVQPAKDATPRFTSAWFVPLADVNDGALVPRTVAETLLHGALPAGSKPMEEILRIIGDQSVLLVLDNFEHLLGGTEETPLPLEETAPAAAFLADLMQKAPGLSCLVTSRVLVGVPGEREFAVGPLPVPTSTASPERLNEFAGVQLFVHRARTVTPRFALTNENAPAVAGLCQRLEGIPLALELAAAWAGILAPAQMLERLERPLRATGGGAARFDLLVSRNRNLPNRHRSLRQVLEWSYRMLTPEQKQFLARLSVFRGGWTIEAAEVICAPPGEEWDLFALEHLMDLRRASFVLDAVEARPEYGEREESGAARMRLLETVREFAEEKASASLPQLRERHAHYYAGVAEQCGSQLMGAEQGEALAQLDAEQDNLRAALSWAIESDLAVAFRIGGKLWHYWEIRGRHNEGRKWLDEALRRDTLAAEHVASTERAAALMNAGNLILGDSAGARRYYEEALAVSREQGDGRLVGALHNNLGLLAMEQGEIATAKTHYAAALEDFRRNNRSHAVSVALNNLGIAAAREGDYPTARRYYEESLALKRAIGNQLSVAGSLNNLGHLARLQGDYPAAQAYCEQALAIMRELGDRFKTAPTLDNLARVHQLRGQFDAAHSCCRECLLLREEMGDENGTITTLETLATVTRQRTPLEAAVTLWAGLRALEARIGGVNTSDPHDPVVLESELALLRSALEPDAFARAWSRGEGFPFDALLRFALSLP